MCAAENPFVGFGILPGQVNQAIEEISDGIMLNVRAAHFHNRISHHFYFKRDAFVDVTQFFIYYEVYKIHLLEYLPLVLF